MYIFLTNTRVSYKQTKQNITEQNKNMKYKIQNKGTAVVKKHKYNIVQGWNWTFLETVVGIA